MAMAELVNMRKDNTPLSLVSLSSEQDLPLPYLEQIFLKLKKAGLLKSCRGASGGYLLAKDSSEISILDIIYAIDGPFKSTRCDGKSVIGCQKNGKRCVTHNLWASLDITIQGFFKAITLENVCQKATINPSFFLSSQSIERVDK